MFCSAPKTKVTNVGVAICRAPRSEMAIVWKFPLSTSETLLALESRDTEIVH